MKKILKRTLATMMVVLMVLTSVPFAGFAGFEVNATDEIESLAVEFVSADSLLAENGAGTGISFFEDEEFYGCYGNQLYDVPEEIYGAMFDYYVADEATGAYEYTFKWPFRFEAEISDGNIVVNQELKDIKSEISWAVQAAMDAFLYDHPEVFWLKNIHISYDISVTYDPELGYQGCIEEIMISPVEIYPGASDNIIKYNNAVADAFEKITVSESRYETLKSIHDYICNNAWYNLSDDSRVHSSEAFFIGDGGVVCEGYAKTFKVLCDKLSIPCVLVNGDADGAHMWNYVQMEDNKWYLVDVTWDDQESKIYDTYFLANSNTVGFDDLAIKDERITFSDFSGSSAFWFAYPVLSDNEYTIHNHQWDDDYTVDVAPSCTESGSKSIHCDSCDETKNVTEIPATNHKNKTESAKQDVSCTADGYTAGVYCPDCNKWFSGHEVIPSYGHTYGGWEDIVEADCDTVGARKKVCSVCGVTTVESVPYSHNDSDKDSKCDLCGAFVSKFTTADYQDILTSFLFSGRDIQPGETAADSVVAWVLNFMGAFSAYYDSETMSYTVPYSEYIKIVDDNFVNHSDMKAYITQNGYWTDASKTTVRWSLGGLGGPTGYTLASVDYGENGKITVQGIALDYAQMDYEGMRHNYEYIYRTYSYTDENGQKVEGICKSEIFRDLELVLYEDDDKLRIYSFRKTDYHILDGNLYYDLGDYVQKYNSFTADYPESVSVTSNGEPIENMFTSFHDNKLLWFAQGEALSFKITSAAGTKIVSVKATDENGTRELIPAASGTYSFIPSGSTVLSVEVECDKCDYVSEITTPSTCKQQGINTYTCKKCGASYTEKLPLKEHSFTEKIIDSAHLVSKATTASPAVYKYDCANCDTVSDNLTFTHGDKLKVTLGKAEKIVAAQNTSTIKIAWTPVDGATGYKVYQSVNGKWKSLGNVGSTSAVIGNLSSGTKYSFAVLAGANVDGETFWADSYTVINTATQAIKPVKVASAQNTSAIKLAWTACPGATGYRIFYKAGNTWKVAVSTTSATSHTFTGLKPGVKFIFAVRPYIITGSGVVWSDYTQFMTSTTPATVTAKAASLSKGNITLTWNAVNGADGYQVYYKTGNGALKLYKVYPKAGTLTFSNLSSGAQYTFVVRAGIKTSGGNIYGGYKAAAVTVK